jgi:Leucine-rich repeat (LRR) protein
VADCCNLKVLDLDENNIREVKVNDIPSSVTELSLKGNKLISLDVSNLPNLIYLLISKNQLKGINL